MTSVSETSLVGRLESGPDASRDYGLHLRKYQALCDEAKETIGRLTRELGRVGSQNYRLIGELADMKSRALTAEAQRDGAVPLLDRAVFWLDRYQSDHPLDDNDCEELDALIRVAASAIRAARQKPDQEGTQLTKPASTQNIRTHTATTDGDLR